MFDFSLDNLDDPKRQALLLMAAGLLSPQDRRLGKGGQFAAALSQGMQGGLMGFNNASQEKRRAAALAQETKIREMQADSMRRDSEMRGKIDALGPQYFQPAMTQDDPSSMKFGESTPAKDDNFGYAQALKQLNPQAGIALQAQLAAATQKQFHTKKQDEDVWTTGPDGMPKVALPGTIKPKELPSGMELGPDGRPRFMPEYIKGQAEIRAAGRPPATQVTTNVLPPREVFKDSLGLKKDFDGQPEVKGFKEVQGAWDQISTALQKPSPANDMAAATKFMKLLDPGSVVRESELMMAMQASGALDRFTNTADRVLKGHKLTPEQRKDFYSAGEALYSASKDRYSQTVEQYGAIAKQYGLDAQFIQNAKPRKSNSRWSIQRVQ